MKWLRWLILLPLLALVFFVGFYLGRGDGYWDRFEGEIFITQLVSSRKGALTTGGKAYLNQLIDMNVHSYLMSDDHSLRGEAKRKIENILVRLIGWKVENGYQPGLPEPDASAEFKLGPPPGTGSAHGLDMGKEYKRYRKRLDAFLEAKFPRQDWNRPVDPASP